MPLTSLTNHGSKILAAAALVVAITLAASVGASRVGAQSPPVSPYIYGGAVSVNGQPAPDGYTIHATVGDYQSAPATIMGGRYEGLAVAPTGNQYNRQTVMFYLGNVLADRDGRVPAKRRARAEDLRPHIPVPARSNADADGGGSPDGDAHRHARGAGRDDIRVGQRIPHGRREYCRKGRS